MLQALELLSAQARPITKRPEVLWVYMEGVHMEHFLMTCAESIMANIDM